MTYFHIKRTLKQRIKALSDQIIEYEEIKAKTIARNKKANDIYNNPCFQHSADHPLYKDAQEILSTAKQMVQESSELIHFLDYCINDCKTARTYFISKLSQLII